MLKRQNMIQADVKPDNILLEVQMIATLTVASTPLLRVCVMHVRVCPCVSGCVRVYRVVSVCSRVRGRGRGVSVGVGYDRSVRS